MTKATYTIPEERRAEVEKIIRKYSAKAANYGGMIEAEYGDTYCAKIPVYTEEDEKVGEELHECFDLTITSEPIRLNGYTPVAMIEHMKGGKLVTMFNGEDIKPEWMKIEPHCQHCGANHGLKKTFIVRGENGEKQVGKTCLKDYCGIDPQTVGINNQLTKIILEEEKYYEHDTSRAASYALDTVEALALAIETCRKHGYVKSGELGSNKERITDRIRRDEVASEESLAEAEAMASQIRAMTIDEACDEGIGVIHTLLRNGYCKASHLGYIAYAPIAYKHMLERREKEAAKQKENDKLEYVGEVGKRSVFKIAKFEHLAVWQNDYGTTHLYKFITEDGNILIWYASKLFGKWVTDDEGYEQYMVYEDLTAIKATVKEHTIYNGAKQTVITRCVAA